MPQADFKYSADLTIDATALLAAVEETILGHDGGAGKCKGRAIPVSAFHHSHVILEVAMLEKPHRDDAFTKALLQKLEHTLEAYLPGPCEVALKVSYNPLTRYITKSYSPS